MAYDFPLDHVDNIFSDIVWMGTTLWIDIMVLLGNSVPEWNIVPTYLDCVGFICFGSAHRKKGNNLRKLTSDYVGRIQPFARRNRGVKNG